MGEHDDTLHHRLIVGQMMREQWEANPPDPAEWARALEGCAQLYQHAARHLAADPPRYLEAVRCLGLAVDTGVEVRGQTIIAYGMSGQAADDLLSRLRDSLGHQEDGHA